VKHLVISLLITLSVGSAQAFPVVQEWTILTDPYFFEQSPGPDNWWGWGETPPIDDDFTGEGTNIYHGSWAYDVASLSGSRMFFGSGRGAFTTQLETDTGEFTYLNFDTESDSYNRFPGGMDSVSTASLDPSGVGGVNGGVVDLSASTFSFNLDTIDNFGTQVNGTGTGWFVQNGFSPEDVHSPEAVIDSLNFAIGFLPSNWDTVAVFQSDLWIPDPFFLPGTATFFAYSTVVPVPAAVWLLGSAIGALILKRRVG